MRSLVRWRTYQRTGSFSGRPKPRSGHQIPILGKRDDQTRYIDAVYQARPEQFAGWLRATHDLTVLPEDVTKPADRLRVLGSLDLYPPSK